MARSRQKKKTNWMVRGAVWLSVGGLLLFILGVLLTSFLDRVRESNARKSCAKNLSKIYKLLQMYTDYSEADGGGGFYPKPNRTSAAFFQPLVERGLLKDPKEVRCFGQRGRKRAPARLYYVPSHFDLTENPERCHYGSPRKALGAEDADPNLVITGDRWVHRGLGSFFGSWNDESTVGRNFLLTTGKVVFVKRGDDRYHDFLGQIWE